MARGHLHSPFQGLSLSHCEARPKQSFLCLIFLFLMFLPRVRPGVTAIRPLRGLPLPYFLPVRSHSEGGLISYFLTPSRSPITAVSFLSRQTLSFSLLHLPPVSRNKPCHRRSCLLHRFGHIQQHLSRSLVSY